ncbi:MAG: baseplate J/gp47 family protein [Saprospiraceae bacterium]
MAFEIKKYTNIFEDMRNGIPPALDDFEVGSVTRTLVESFSYELALLYEKMNLVYLSAFVDTAQGSHLDNVVAVLGIRRSLPDFSVGAVKFVRDTGKEDITIPIGTLVATEDTPEKPKKVYQTIEQKILAGNQTEVSVKIQAVERGEEQDTEANTIIVMPRPIPGIKEVTNPEPVKLVGKRRETDDELRERAKNALISSGKATILSIENAVLSLPGVLDVKVRERFHFAEGEISIIRPDANGNFTLPRGTQFGTDTLAGRILYQTKDDVEFLDEEAQADDVRVQSLAEGKAGEAFAGATLTFEDSSFSTYTIQNTKDILLGEYGVIEVFVDAPEFEKPEMKEAIEAAVDRVRAAGILTLLEAAKQVQVDGAFRIEASGQANLTPENRAALENQVRSELIIFFQELRMGRPLLFSKLIKNVLSIEGVDNLADFRLTTFKEISPSETRKNNYLFSNNKILVDEFEILKARDICVASEDKLLPVDIEFKASGITPASTFGNLTALFSGKKMGDAVRRSEISTALLNDVGAFFNAPTLKIKATSWCERTVLVEEGGDVVVNTLFVEKPILGDVFAYNNYLDIVGAAKLVLPLNVTADDKAAVLAAAKTALDDYINHLKSEEDFVFEDLTAALSGLEKVLAVELDVEDFQAMLNGTSLPQRITDKAIDIQPFEKTRAEFFALATDTTTLEVDVTGLDFNVIQSGDPIPSNVISQLRDTVVHTVNNYLAGTGLGEDLIYDNLRSALSNLTTDVSYTVKALSLNAVSSADGRTQTATITAPNDIHVRSVELAVMKPFVGSSLNVVIEVADE